MRYRLATAENIASDRGSCYRPVSVTHILDVSDIGDVRYVSHVADIGDVDHAQVISAEVIPGKEWFPGSQRKPAHQATANTDTDGEARASKKCNESRGIDGHGDDGTRQPSPA